MSDVVFIPSPTVGGSVLSFLNLIDTPTAFGNPGDLVSVNPTGNGLIFTPPTVGAGVQSVTGLNTDNTDPANPIVAISVDGVTITGSGTPGDPLVSSGGSGGGIRSSFISFNDAVQSSSLTYERVAAFPFPGTAIIPSLSKINALVRRNGAATSVSIRIYDASNAQVIAERSGIVTLDNTFITDLGTISNLPAGEATFEIQLLRVGGPGGARAFCSGLEIRV
jgi:hypothetical protein